MSHAITLRAPREHARAQGRADAPQTSRAHAGVEPRMRRAKQGHRGRASRMSRRAGATLGRGAMPRQDKGRGPRAWPRAAPREPRPRAWPRAGTRARGPGRATAAPRRAGGRVGEGRRPDRTTTPWPRHAGS
jgi:hypothetical protein